MAKRCDICSKGTKKAASRSHSKIKTLRKQKVNLQKLDGKSVCTRCMRTKTNKAK